MADQKDYRTEGEKKKNTNNTIKSRNGTGKYAHYRAKGRTEISRAKRRLRGLLHNPQDIGCLESLNQLPAHAIAAAKKEAASLRDVA